MSFQLDDDECGAESTQMKGPLTSPSCIPAVVSSMCLAYSWTEVSANSSKRCADGDSSIVGASVAVYIDSDAMAIVCGGAVIGVDGRIW